LRAFTFGHVRQLDRLLAELLKRAWAADAGPAMIRTASSRRTRGGGEAPALLVLLRGQVVCHGRETAG